MADSVDNIPKFHKKIRPAAWGRPVAAGRRCCFGGTPARPESLHGDGWQWRRQPLPVGQKVHRLAENYSEPSHYTLAAASGCGAAGLSSRLLGQGNRPLRAAVYLFAAGLIPCSLQRYCLVSANTPRHAAGVFINLWQACQPWFRFTGGPSMLSRYSANLSKKLNKNIMLLVCFLLFAPLSAIPPAHAAQDGGQAGLEKLVDRSLLSDLEAKMTQKQMVKEVEAARYAEAASFLW